MQSVINDDIRDDILPTFLSRWPLLLFFLSLQALSRRYSPRHYHQLFGRLRARSI